MTTDELRSRWAEAERIALEAEMKVAAVGQAAADPRVAALFKSAADLRAAADQLLRELVAADLKDRQELGGRP
jgi:hypothetical protein